MSANEINEQHIGRDVVGYRLAVQLDRNLHYRTSPNASRVRRTSTGTNARRYSAEPHMLPGDRNSTRRVVGERRSAFLGDAASENAPLIAKKHRTRRAGTHDDAVLLPHLGRSAIERGQVGSLLAHRLVGEGAGAAS